MHQKNIFVILGCCGLPFVLYDLVCLAGMSYAFLTDGLTFLGSFLYTLLLILPVFLYVLIFFYMSIGQITSLIRTSPESFNGSLLMMYF